MVMGVEWLTSFKRWMKIRDIFIKTSQSILDNGRVADKLEIELNRFKRFMTGSRKRTKRPIRCWVRDITVYFRDLEDWEDTEFADIA